MTFLESDRRRAGLVIALCTLVGGFLRIGRLGRLGLVQFDEGIYAIAGLWSLAPAGLLGLDPMIIPYAPPGFAILVGLAYAVTGVSDVSAIVASILCGIVTIPVVGWIGWRTFGPTAGATSAAFAALSGAHVAFSRMALTDAAFLLTWLIAIGLGQRFLERPALARAVAMGLAVGVAQNFKYNGWLTGATSALAVLLGMVFDRGERGPSRIARMVAFGTIAALTSALVYWPWLRFVEAHGGYAGLLAHQRGYLGGYASWLPHWRSQLAQGVALSGGPAWGAVAMLLAWGGTWFSSPMSGRTRAVPRFGAAALGAVLLGWWPMLPWWVALGWTLGDWTSRPVAARVLGSWWVLLSVLTPFYHPYARLLLPLHAANWIIMAGVIASLDRELAAPGDSRRDGRLPRRVLVVIGLSTAIGVGQALMDTPRPRPLRGLLGPSDSLRNASHELLSALPADVRGLRLLARPPVRFYLALAGRVEIRGEPDVKSLLQPVEPAPWAVVDEALLRQEGDLASARGRLLLSYDLVGEWPTELNLPTLLDVDPGAARRASDARLAPLLLLRPRRPRASP